MEKIKVGAALCGSFCTLDAAVSVWEGLAATGNYALTPIFSETAYGTDSRFGPAEEFIRRMETACGRGSIHTVPQAEPIGPKGLLDVLVIAPCTGNTLSKMAHGVTDTAVTMAAKAQLRTGKPVVLAIATNDALSGSAESIGALLNRKNVYFVPFRQDDPAKKPASLVAELSKLEETMRAALEGKQTQPILLG